MHPCIHLKFVFYDHKSSKSLNLVSIWSFDEFSGLCLRFLTIKPIGHLTMVCYHQNPIRRTIGLTISPFFYDDKPWLSMRKKNLPLKPIMDQTINFQYETNVKQKHLNRKQWIMKITYHIYMVISHVHKNITYMLIKIDMTMICMRVS